MSNRFEVLRFGSGDESSGKYASWGGNMALRMRVHDREPIGLALRRFKKLLERSGIQKELRKRKYYEKPCEERRRAKLRKQSAIRKAKLGPKSM
jgi:small subunit ribosomal protein S21